MGKEEEEGNGGDLQPGRWPWRKWGPPFCRGRGYTKYVDMGMFMALWEDMALWPSKMVSIF